MGNMAMWFLPVRPPRFLMLRSNRLAWASVAGGHTIGLQVVDSHNTTGTASVFLNVIAPPTRDEHCRQRRHGAAIDGHKHLQ